MFDAIVLAGGTSRRFGSDKTAAQLDGTSLLDRVIAAVDTADRVVVVGPRRQTDRSVCWAREEPPGGGPVAAIAAGLAEVDAAWCLVLAADLPWIAPAVPLLLSSAAGSDVAVLERDGRRNLLAACWHTEALRAALDELGPVRDAAVHSLFAGRDVLEVRDEGGWGRDCDTVADLDEARR